MDLCRAVFLMEEDASIPVDGKPLMLEAILGRPILERAAKQCMADGSLPRRPALRAGRAGICLCRPRP